MFNLKSNFSPTGDQPQAIERLTAGVSARLKNQVLLGVTGSGKTFTMANVIKSLQMPALIISHNKTLAGQLYQEFRDFFPQNAVSYFVSYYDFYQPEAYIPTTDTYIEKEAQINAVIDKLRLQATTNLLTRRDVIVVASVSCIYNIGSPKEYGNFILPIGVGDVADFNKIARRLIDLQYARSDYEFKRGTFRIRGEYMDIYPAYEDYAYRVNSKGFFPCHSGESQNLCNKNVDSDFHQNDNMKINNLIINHIAIIDPVSGQEKEEKIEKVIIYPAKHFMMSPDSFAKAESQIRSDLAREVAALKKQKKEFEAKRLLQKVNYDLEMIKEVGYVNGIENYSRYFDGRTKGDPPYSLINYFREMYGDDFLVFIDESHMTVPQIRGMFNGDHARKKTLIDFGFRMQAALDNRPMKFEEFYNVVPKIIYVSATPDSWEIEKAEKESRILNLESRRKTIKDPDSRFQIPDSGIIEQLVRPTGIVDPEIEVRPAKDEVKDLIREIERRVHHVIPANCPFREKAGIYENKKIDSDFHQNDKKGQKILVTTLTKKTAEDLSIFLKEKNIRAAYLHSDIKTLERSDVLDKLRRGEFDVLIGVNLLREGLDLPEVSLVAILDADREGFLRSRVSLIQTMGRAARNVQGKVILYADTVTGSMKEAISEIDRRRKYQIKYNLRHGITPKTIEKKVREKIAEEEKQGEIWEMREKREMGENYLKNINPESLTPNDKNKIIKRLEREMKRQAEGLNFEEAIKIREKIKELSL